MLGTVSGGIELEVAVVFGDVTVAVPAGWDPATETMSIVDRATDDREHVSSRKVTPDLVVWGAPSSAT